ncbi:MAG: hypothetical protein HY706_04045 [Candidatus Hydrogenedentes bacterium]|nr:hypothetical protein [Candidatus Hydrogenedentota bacterium]
MRVKMRTWTAGVLLALLIGLGTMGIAALAAERPDCPGKIICPLTGAPVCKDRCPVLPGNSDDGQPGTGRSCCASK